MYNLIVWWGLRGKGIADLTNMFMLSEGQGCWKCELYQPYLWLSFGEAIVGIFVQSCLCGRGAIASGVSLVNQWSVFSSMYSSDHTMLRFLHRRIPGVMRRTAFELCDWYLSPYKHFPPWLKITWCLAGLMGMSSTDMNGIPPRTSSSRSFSIRGCSDRGLLFRESTRCISATTSIGLACDFYGWQYGGCHEFWVYKFEP